MKKILVINGHPRAGSYCDALALAYVRGARKTGARVRYVKVRDLKFDALNREDMRKRELEHDLKKMQSAIRDSNHVVFVYPVWWGSMPALLKGFFDRIITPGFAFRYRKDGWGWHRLLKGRSARIIVTAGGPWILNHIAYHNSAINMTKWATLWFSGFGPVKVTEFPSIDTKWMTQKKRKRNIEDVEKVGEQDAKE